jgi:hypothetical protein
MPEVNSSHDAIPFKPIGRVTSIVLTIAIGLLSRKFAHALPALLSKNTGDILWAVVLYQVVSWGMKQQGVKQAVLASLTISVGVELYKFVHFPAADAFRETAISKLLLGTKFSFTNLVCYAIGIAVAAAIEWQFRRRLSTST